MKGGPTGTYTDARGRRFFVKPCPACKRGTYKLEIAKGEGACSSCGYKEALLTKPKERGR